MNDYVMLPIVGAVVSVLVQFIKSSLTLSKPWTIAFVVVLSALAGAVYYFLGGTEAWEAGLQILLYANAVYGFIIKSFQKRGSDGATL